MFDAECRAVIGETLTDVLPPAGGVSELHPGASDQQNRGDDLRHQCLHASLYDPRGE